MARRRIVTDEIIHKKEFNSLSIEAQAMWTRILVKTDDCGVIPADPDELRALCNIPSKIKPEKILAEFQANGLGLVFEYNGATFFAFNPGTFDRVQSWMLGKRTKSEYLRLKWDEFQAFISEQFPYIGIPGNSRQNPPEQVESRKKKVESRKTGESEGEPEKQPESPTVEYLPKRGAAEKLRTFEEMLPPELFARPGFVEQWRKWIQMRREKGRAKAVDETAAGWNIRELQKLRGDPVEIVMQSVGRKWEGFFEVKEGGLTANAIANNNQSQYNQRAGFSYNAEVRAGFDKLEQDCKIIEQTLRGGGDGT